MSQIEALNRRYAAASAVARNGVEIVLVGDQPGAQLNMAVRRLLKVAVGDGPGIWDDLIGAAKVLRWRRLTQPQPVEFNPALSEGALQVVRQAGRLRGAVANESLLDEFILAANELARSDSDIGELLLRSIDEVGGHGCVVVAANRPAQGGLAEWLVGSDVSVITVGDLARAELEVDQAYVVGPPRFFSSSLVTAPATSEITFVLPGWFSDRTVPRSAIAPYAEGAIRTEARVLTEGDVTDVGADVQTADAEDEFLPQPVWGTIVSSDRDPTGNEVEAVKVLLSGNLAVWLDDGDRIRALDPTQPVGERVTYTEVSAVRRGTYLLLKQGESEHGALYQAALRLLGERADSVHATQQEWKTRLGERLSHLGHALVVRQLKAEAVKAAERARAWIEPTLIRPASDDDLERLLRWLNIPIQPTFGHATLLRKMLYQASADIREQLESAIGAADLSVLEQNGHLSLDVQEEGLRGIVATRVLAISPHAQIVARHDARVPFEDRSGQWLE